jgi:predicted RNA binding protein YcfA (HicA-like mRNA interferase family)
MSRIRCMTAGEVERILQSYGFELISQKGSHRKWRNSEQKVQVIVPYHKGRDLPTGTLRNIMTTANIAESEWKTD